MRLALLLAAVFCLALPARAQVQQVLYPGLEGEALLSAIRADFTPAQTLGYNPARDSLFSYEQRSNGGLRCVYTGYTIQLTPGADPSTDAFNKGINTEHTWPQSMGASGEPSRSDMHHLYATRDNVNSSRGNHPYAEIPDAQTATWYRLDQSQSAIPSVFIDEWSERATSHPDPGFSSRFEPREDHKGDAARAVFYYRTIYASQVAAFGSEPFFLVQLPDLLAWTAQDRVSATEYARSEWIATRQGTRNPFVLDSTLARRAFRAGPTPEPPVALWINEVHYRNAGADAGEGVEIAGAAGTGLDGFRVVLYDGATGAPYAELPLAGTIPDQQAGFGTRWLDAPGLQDGDPDGLALVRPSGAVVQFLSYGGAVTATAGPAMGLTSRDIGLTESGTAAPGLSLQLGGSGVAYDAFAWQPEQAATLGQPNTGQTFGRTEPLAWINEIHYDNAGTDEGEGVEIAGAAGTTLDGWELAFYNGSSGALYATLPLTGTLADQAAGFGTRWFTQVGLQNGAPDGIALVDSDGAVVQFLSYEGVMTATGGPADGMESENIGVEQSNATPIGQTLQLVGTGGTYADFAWSGPITATTGLPNTGQTFVRATAGEAAPVAEAPVLRVAPNPSAGHATAHLTLHTAAEVRLEVYDALGRRLSAAPPLGLDAGTHALPLDAAALAPGLYVVRVVLGDTQQTVRFAIVR